MKDLNFQVWEALQSFYSKRIRKYFGTDILHL